MTSVKAFQPTQLITAAINTIFLYIRTSLQFINNLSTDIL